MPVVDSGFTGPPRWFGVAPYALDSNNARRLWELSLQLVEEAMTTSTTTAGRGC